MTPVLPAAGDTENTSGVPAVAGGVVGRSRRRSLTYGCSIPAEPVWPQVTTVALAQLSGRGPASASKGRGRASYTSTSVPAAATVTRPMTRLRVSCSLAASRGGESGWAISTLARSARHLRQRRSAPYLRADHRKLGTSFWRSSCGGLVTGTAPSIGAGRRRGCQNVAVHMIARASRSSPRSHSSAPP